MAETETTTRVDLDETLLDLVHEHVPELVGKDPDDVETWVSENEAEVGRVALDAVARHFKGQGPAGGENPGASLVETLGWEPLLNVAGMAALTDGARQLTLAMWSDPELALKRLEAAEEQIAIARKLLNGL